MRWNEKEFIPFKNPVGRPKGIHTTWKWGGTVVEKEEGESKLYDSSLVFRRKAIKFLASPVKKYPVCATCKIKFVPIEKWDKKCFKCKFIEK